MAKNQEKTQQYATGKVAKFDVLPPNTDEDGTVVKITVDHEGKEAIFSRVIHTPKSYNLMLEKQEKPKVTTKEAAKQIAGFRQWLNEHICEAFRIDKITEEDIVGKSVNYPYTVTKKGNVIAEYLNPIRTHHYLEGKAKKKAIDELFG